MTAQATNAKAGSAKLPPRVPPLTNRHTCARFLAQLVRAAYRDELELDKAKALAYMVQTLAGLLGDAEADDKLRELEARLAGYEAGRS